MSKINPGPLTAINLPNRKITARSYSRKIRIALAKIINRNTIPVINNV
jgi:hypothetical protein